MGAGWYFSKDNNPSNMLVDDFADSKFSIDKWKSFAREIIQNSLDAQDDATRPVEVVFDLNKELTIDDIPGANETRDILIKCEKAASNKQTKGAYKNGIEILSKEYIYCLKISDYNTKGVGSGRDGAWGALVYDEGKSVKLRPGSAGSHGVGKKVTFIISACNTVFYSTYNTNDDGTQDHLLEGKTILINWFDDDNQKRSNKGWFGNVTGDEDYRNAVTPLTLSQCENINPYFVRADSLGTDVIIVGVNLYENEILVKKSIIRAILENFFVSIKENKLSLNVLGETISKDTFDDVYEKYCADDYVDTGLSDELRVFSGEPDQSIDIFDRAQNEKWGTVEIHFGLENKNNKKEYSVVRSHGMKIRKYRINNADQPYSAVAIIHGQKLNELLSSLENAAHDDFIVDDENIKPDEDAKYALNTIRKEISKYVVDKCKFDEQEGQEIEGLNNILSIPGMAATVRIKSNKPLIRKRPVSKKSPVDAADDFPGGQSSLGGGKKKKKTKGQGNKPGKAGNQGMGTVYEDFETEPYYMKSKNRYIFTFKVKENLNKADIEIRSVNSDGANDSTINDVVKDVMLNGKKMKVTDGKIRNVSMVASEKQVLLVPTKIDVRYELTMKIYDKGEHGNE